MTQCVFCAGSHGYPAFEREGRIFARCRDCRGYWQPDPRIASEEYESGGYVERVESTLGKRPALGAFDEIAPLLKPGRLLEIGAGTGHFLAAAKLRGFAVAAVETSERHRDYMRENWGIESASEPIELNPFPEGSFDNAVALNLIEHVAQPQAFVSAVQRALRPGGIFFLSTPNADCLVPHLFGRWWSMFKPPDHVAIPSARSLHTLGDRAGLSVLRVWCSEYPLETPFGIMVALRDWLAARHGASDSGTVPHPPNATVKTARRLIRSRAFRFVANATSRMMIAASVKALYQKGVGQSAIEGPRITNSRSAQRSPISNTNL